MRDVLSCPHKTTTVIFRETLCVPKLFTPKVMHTYKWRVLFELEVLFNLCLRQPKRQVYAWLLLRSAFPFCCAVLHWTAKCVLPMRQRRFPPEVSLWCFEKYGFRSYCFHFWSFSGKETGLVLRFILKWKRVTCSPSYGGLVRFSGTKGLVPVAPRFRFWQP